MEKEVSTGLLRVEKERQEAWRWTDEEGKVLVTKQDIKERRKSHLQTVFNGGHGI